MEDVSARTRVEECALDATMARMLRRYPTALVAAINSDGLFVEMPPTIALSGHHVPQARFGLELIAPDSHSVVIDTWDQALLVGEASAPVVLVNGVAAMCHVLDVRSLHGVVVGIVVADEETELVAELARRPPMVPKTGRIDKDEQAVICSADERVCQILGFEAAELVGTRSRELIHPDDRDRAVTAWMEMLTTPGESSRVRLRHLRRDGSWLWMELTNTNLLGRPEGRVVTEMIDVSEEMAALESVRQREQLLGRLAEALPSGVLHVDQERRVVYANERLYRVVGQGASATIDAQLANVIPEDQPSLAAAMDTALIDGHDADLEVRLRVPDAPKLLLCAIAIRVLTDADSSPAGAVLCVDNVTVATELRVELERRATIDELTGCLNRAAVLAELERTLRRHTLGSPGTAVVFLDLDGFKAVNDTLGHHAGDELLTGVAARLRDVLRGVDVLGRLGGDEFLVLVPHVDSLEGAARVGSRLSKALSEPIDVAGGMPMRVKASIGVAWSSAPDITADILTRAADLAMYESKRAGRAEPVFVNA